jgi:hypothetical protein
MCISSKPKRQAPPPPPPPPPKAPQKASESVRRSRDENKRKFRNLSGDASTQITGPRGLMAPAATAGTSLLGSG